MLKATIPHAESSYLRCAAYFPTSEAEGIRISFPESKSLRSRKIVTRSRARKTGKLPSWKMARMIQWESDNERIVFRILDGDTTVKAFFEQPFKVCYVSEGVDRIHFPDVLIEFHDGIEVWEIKDSRSSDRSGAISRTNLLVPLFAQLGIRYRLVFVNKKCQTGIEAYSLSMLRLGRLPITQIEREFSRRAFTQQKAMFWSEIRAGSLGERGPNIVARLLLEGELTSSDRSRALSPETKIFASFRKEPLVAEWRS